MTPVQAGSRKTTTMEAAAAHLLPGRSLFAQRLLRQGRVESNFHHAAGGGRGVQKKTQREDSECVSRRWNAGMRGSGAAPRCDALYSLGFIWSFRWMNGGLGTRAADRGQTPEIAIIYYGNTNTDRERQNVYTWMDQVHSYPKYMYIYF